MIAVGMMDRIIELHVKSADVDDDYGGLKTYRWAPVAEKTFAHVIWKSGEVNEAGEQMQNKQICEFYVRNSGAFANANVEDMIVFDSDKFYIDLINVVDGRIKYLKIQGTQVSPTNPQV